jgi:SAM-dependent methyltransferase
MALAGTAIRTSTPRANLRSSAQNISERLLRRFFPSVSLLTFNPVFRTVINGMDAFFPLGFEEFKSLPPNHMRVRVGVGNRLFGNQVHYLLAAKDFWLSSFANYGLTLSANIVDLGCGCGRYAHHLRDIKLPDGSYSGAYVGVDIDAEMIEWCRKHFDPRFRFHQSTDGSSSYSRKSKMETLYRVPEMDGGADFVFSTSLFTHLLEEAVGHYIRESFRLLRPGGIAHHTIFCTDYLPLTFGSRHTFRHKIGNAFVESVRQPEAAVAYSASRILELAENAGFTTMTVVPGMLQSTLILKR